MQWRRNEMGFVLVPESTEEASRLFKIITEELKPKILKRKLTLDEVRAINGYCKNIDSK